VTNPDRYPTEVFWSDEDEGFIAIARDLPGCSAFGATREQACAELLPAIVAWIEAAQAAGNPVPHPSARPEYSGKLLVRMPKSLHADLAHQAAIEAVSLNQYVVVLLAERHATRKHTPITVWQLSHTASKTAKTPINAQDISYFELAAPKQVQQAWWEGVEIYNG
jgi:antitoxin HicB